MNIKQEFDQYGCPRFNVKPHKGMTWLDLADAICEHKDGVSFHLTRDFVWDDATAKSGKWIWYASFRKTTDVCAYDDISGGRPSENMDETIVTAIKRLIGNTLVRSPYAVFKSLEKDHHWHLPYEDDDTDVKITLKLK